MEGLLSRLASWADAHVQNTVRVVLILAAAYVLTKVLKALIRRVETFVERMDGDILSDRDKRARTLGRVLRQAVTIAVWSLAIVEILGEVGVSIGPIVAGAGIAGLAVGFGAQALVKDIISGFFMLLENQFRVGDVVSVAGATGVVEAINLRTTVLRDNDGRVYVVPNGTIGVVTNHTRGWARAVVDVPVPYREDVDHCTAVLRTVGKELETDPRIAPMLAGSFEAPSVERLQDASFLLRLAVRTKPHDQMQVTRELRLRIKKAFDEQGIALSALSAAPTPPSASST